MPERQIPLIGRHPYEVAAKVLAILGFPDADEMRQEEVANRLCSWFVYEFARRALPKGIDPEPIIRPRYAMIPEELVVAEKADLCRRLERRLTVKRHAIGTPYRRLTGTPQARRLVLSVWHESRHLQVLLGTERAK